jgi:two-component system, NtrC family, sensor kinase
MEAAASTLTLLVLEDEVAIRNLIVMEFEDQGFHILEASTLAEARTHFANEDVTIDIAIFDLRLPDGDGLALLNEVKDNGFEGPVVMITGQGNKHIVLESLKAGAYDLLEKPFSMSGDLIPVVARAQAAVRLQKENQSLTEQILHNSKLAALGELSATVLHDIRGPLSLIHVVCDDISDELAENIALDPQAVQTHIAQIRKACDRIRKLGDHLRNFSRQDKDEAMENKPIENLIEDSLFLVQQKTRTHRIKVIKSIDSSAQGLSLRCQPNKLEQVIMNLLSNACDAMLSCSQKELGLCARKEGNWLMLDVSDTGTGIPLEIQERMFENFFTTKPRGEGTGLGLKIVRNIVVDHGGELLLQSTVGKGTTFTVKLPLRFENGEGESDEGETKTHLPVKNSPTAPYDDEVLELLPSIVKHSA